MNRLFLRQGAVLSLVAASVFSSPTNAGAAGKLVLKSAISVDAVNHTVTLPLHRGEYAGTPVWYVITDASDAGVARSLGVVFSPNLANIGSGALQHVTKGRSGYVFEGAPDFSKTRTYVAGKTGFPPESATPGSVADANYSPFIKADGTPGVLNAPIVATGAGGFDVIHHTNTEDRVIAIDTGAKSVTLALARGFVGGKAVNYLSTEASDPVAAAVERATFTPKLKNANPAAEIPIGVVVNGPMSQGAGQGLAYLALHTPLGEDATPSNIGAIGSPFNVLSLAPNPETLYAQNGYSPLWDVRVLPNGKPQRITDFGSFAELQPKPAGFVVNCPVVAFE